MTEMSLKAVKLIMYLTFYRKKKKKHVKEMWKQAVAK